MRSYRGRNVAAALFLGLVGSCASSPPRGSARGRDVVIDRFSSAFAHLQLRTDDHRLPGPGEPIDFDKDPFITQSRGPAGEIVRYYNLDVQPDMPGTIYVLTDVDGKPLEGARPILDAIPGDPGYSDFVRQVDVTVPAGEDPRALQGVLDIAGMATRVTDDLLNRPVVPAGSTARESISGGPTQLTTAWYRGQLVHVMIFAESVLGAAPQRPTPTSPIFVTFEKNVGEPGGGPASGFVHEPSSVQTHNVVASVPGDLDYSPLWFVQVYSNAAFASVSNLSTAEAAPLLVRDMAKVNCPVVFVGPPPSR